jgi:transposase InsO family protein
MDEKTKFIGRWLSGEYTMTGLCGVHEISRKTGYKWVHRYCGGGPGALEERPRAPHTHPNATPADVVERILKARRKHPTWGPQKLLAWLKRREPSVCWPAASTVGEILRRAGLTKPRRKRRRCSPYRQPFAAVAAPNDVWCADFKGWFRCRNGQRCEPLTITDALSRFLLRCQAVPSTGFENAQRVFDRVFTQYGLPAAIRTDNGTPFASTGLGGLSRLSVWWIKLGIVPERIDSGKPQQNGRHERFHLTLQLETADPPYGDLVVQQHAFERFRHEYNHVRPHEALDGRTPADLYLPSKQRYPVQLEPPDYPAHFEVRRVRRRGFLRWRGKQLFLSKALEDELIGLEPIDERYWTIHFDRYAIGTFDAVAFKVLRETRNQETPVDCN